MKKGIPRLLAVARNDNKKLHGKENLKVNPLRLHAFCHKEFAAVHDHTLIAAQVKCAGRIVRQAVKCVRNAAVCAVPSAVCASVWPREAVLK